MQCDQSEQAEKHKMDVVVGRDMDFSFRFQIDKQKFSRVTNDTRKVESVEKDDNNSRQFEVTLSPTGSGNAQLFAIKRLEQKMNETQQILEKIYEAPNQQTEINFFSNIVCSSQSSFNSEEEQHQSPSTNIILEKSNQVKYNNGIKAKIERDKTIYRVSALIKDNVTQKYVQLDLTIPNVYQGQILIIEGFNKYKKEIMNVCQLSYMRISEKKLPINQIRGLKVLPFIIKEKSFQMELNHKNGRYIFGVELKRQLYFLPEHYIWFAKIINTKLMAIGMEMKKNSLDQKEMVSLGWSGTFCKGTIYKKSKYLKVWSERYVVINIQGLFSYQAQNQNYTVFVPMSQIRQLSTEFDLYMGNLVIRVSTEEEKIDFAIPVHDFCLKIQNNWLFAFYRLLMEHKHHIKIS